MASSGNFCTWDRLRRNQQTQSLTEGNTRFSSTQTSTNPAAVGTFGVTSGKWYWEIKIVNYGNASNSVGVCRTSAGLEGDTTALWNATGDVVFMYLAGGNKRTNGTSSSYGNSWTTGDILQVALDMDNGAVYFGKNNTFQNSGNPASGSSKTGAAFTNLADKGHIQAYSLIYSNGDQSVNFGQDDTFSGRETAAGNTDANGKGVFKYAPPTGYLALCSANLPISDDIDPAQTDTNYLGKQFNTITYTGNGSTQNITGLGFKPDLVWIKERSGTQSPSLYDSNRGVTKRLKSSSTELETTVAAGFTAFGSDGFSLGSATENNDNSETFVAWCWRANEGTTASNSEGSITATVQANQAAGFSIVTYTGADGSWGSTATYGHGLSKAPEFIITIERSVSDERSTFHAHVGNGGGSNAAANNLVLNTSAALYTNQSYKAYAGVMPTSSLVTVEGNTTNSSSSNHVAYIWHSVEGYSKFGSFEGNANNNGPFIYTGFRPRMFFIKSVDTQAPWTVYDGVRGGGFNNPPNSPSQQFWDESLADHTSYGADIYSNGFKLRTSNATVNASGTWVYGAWGDVPFKYNNTF